MTKENLRSSCKRKRRILLTHFPNLHSTSMTGKDSSATLRTSLRPWNSCGLSSITTDGLSGEFTILDMKDKVSLDISPITSRMVIWEILIISESTASLSTESMESKETTKLMEFGCGEELRFLKNGKSIKVMITLPSKSWIPKTKKFKTWQLSIGSISTKDNWSKEKLFSMPSGSNDVSYQQNYHLFYQLFEYLHISFQLNYWNNLFKWSLIIF